MWKAGRPTLSDWTSSMTEALDLTAAFVLPRHAHLTPIEELPDDQREQVGGEPGESALTLAFGRAGSKVVDGPTAELLTLFREPRTIVEAVIEFASAEGLDPEETLEAAYPVLSRLLAAGYLVPADSPAADPPQPRFSQGDRVGSWEVRRCIRMMLDTEIYLARGEEGRAAIKVAREADRSHLERRFDRERRIYELLDGLEVVPRFLGSGEVEGRPYLVLEWCAGHPSNSPHVRWGATRQAHLEFAARTLEAYRRLHERGVLHGDVHAENLMIASDGEVRLIDFGAAKVLDASDELGRAPRMGVAYYYEPEYAAALAAGRRGPPVTLESEQYRIAAVLYSLLTDAHYLDFRLEQSEMLEAIQTDPPLPFTHHGVAGQEAVERVLARALEKSPERRFPSTSDFCEAFAEALDETPAAPGLSAGLLDQAEGVVAELLENAAPDGVWVRKGLAAAPRASINTGAAGVAVALARIAEIRDDPVALATADVWVARALSDLGDHEAFFGPDGELREDIVEEVSLFHYEPGLHVADAIVAQLLGDRQRASVAARRFIRSCSREWENPDLTLGRTGALIGSAILVDRLGADESLLSFGAEVESSVWDSLRHKSPIAGPESSFNLGLAHGWAGVLFASMQWSRVSGLPLRDEVEERLDQLAALAQPHGRGVRWPWYLKGENREPVYMPGWCSGATGHALLWAEAARSFDRDAYLGLASGSAWSAWRTPFGSDHLCCGAAGGAFAMLRLHGTTLEPDWKVRAQRLFQKSLVPPAEEANSPASLYRGRTGIALLAAELEGDAAARMPMLEV